MRTLLTGFAVAIGVMTVVTLGVVTSSLRETAASVIQTGEADFTVGQAGVADVLSSVVQERQLEELEDYPQVESVVGALIVLHPYDADNPLFINIGIAVDKLDAFGVRIVRGVTPAVGSDDQVILGTAAAENLGKRVGDTMLLSFFERTREFGVMRAVGWSRRRVMSLVVLEALVISVLGAALLRPLDALHHE